METLELLLSSAKYELDGLLLIGELKDDCTKTGVEKNPSFIN